MQEELTYSIASNESIVSPIITIQVLTSRHCLFCGAALKQVQKTARNLESQGFQVYIEEFDVDSNPELLEELGIMSLPATIIGNSYISGIPNSQDLTMYIHSQIVSGVD